MPWAWAAWAARRHGLTTGRLRLTLPAAARCAASGSSPPNTCCSGARPSGCLSTGGPSTPPRPG
eukprot:12849744-Alexandrium_andersonii.AAC.1